MTLKMASFDTKNHFKGWNLSCQRNGAIIFSNLDFHLESGATLVLSGANGSGKSSLLGLMAGLLPPSDGHISWNGHCCAENPEDHRARLQYLGHRDAVKPVLTAAEILHFWCVLGSYSPTSHIIEAALDRVGLSALADLPGRFLSAGQKRRLALARLIARPAPLWLLDEPATALDRDGLAILNALIADHRAAGGMVVLSTHADLDLHDTRSICLSDYKALQSEDIDDDIF